MIHEVIKLYPDRQDVTLSTYILNDSVEMLNGKKRPAIIICPGGGYLTCSDREGEPVAMAFAAMGYHAFVLRYSTYSDGASGFFQLDNEMKANPRSLFPAALRDLGKAMLHVRKHAEEWLVDPERIAVCGFSAGAHNCAMYAVYWHDPILTSYFNEKAESFRPAAAILAYGISDFTSMYGAKTCAYAQKLLKSVNIAFTGVEEPDIETLIRISPAFQVNENTPPMFLWTTAEDELVPAEQSLKMATALARKNIPYEIHIFENGPHGLCLATEATAASRFETDRDASKWVSLAETWLRKRFTFDLPEKPFWFTLAGK